MRLHAGPALLAIAAFVALGVGLHYPLWADGTIGSGLMPAVGAGLVLVASVFTLLLGTRRPREPRDIPKVVSYLAAIAALPLAIVALGMLPALALFALAVLVLVERLEIGRALLIAFGSLAFNWIVFDRLLQVSLPRSMFW
jgi:putative tricarboxylic transport membrane protein